MARLAGPGGTLAALVTLIALAGLAGLAGPACSSKPRPAAPSGLEAPPPDAGSPVPTYDPMPAPAPWTIDNRTLGAARR